MSEVDLALVVGEPPPAGLGVSSALALRDGESAAAVAVVGDHRHPMLGEGVE